MIQYFYSNGSLTPIDFEKQPSKSIGGNITTQSIKGNLNSLFGNVSLNQLYGQNTIEYRCIYLKNTNNQLANNIKFWIQKDYIITDEINPLNLTLSDGDKYLIPVGAISSWAGYDGYVGTYKAFDNTWTFKPKEFCEYKFACEPINTIAQVLDNSLTEPWGLEFVSADSYDSSATGTISLESLVGTAFLNEGDYVALWIQRTVNSQPITNKLLESLSVQQGFPMLVKETISFNLEYELFNSFQIEYKSENNYSVDTTSILEFDVLRDLLGEENYIDVSIRANIQWQKVADATKFDASAIFLTNEYTNIEKFANFATSNDMNEILQFIVVFKDTGIFTLNVELFDNNTSEVFAQCAVDIEVS